MDKSKDSCQICKKKFGGVFSNQHQCKRCLRTVCKQCCSKKRALFTKANTKIQQHRCCDVCVPESESISHCIKSHSLAFNTLSKQGKQWSQLADIDVSSDSKSLPLVKSASLKSKTSVDNIYFHDVWSQATPSIRQLAGLLTSKIPLSNVDAAIRKVCQKMMWATGGNFEHILSLVVYLLCYCDQVTAAKVGNYLIKVSEQVDVKNIARYIQLLATSATYDHMSALNEQTLKSLINFSKNISKSLIQGYFTSCLQIDAVHHIVVQTLLSGDYQIIQLACSCIIFQMRKDILADKWDQKGFKNAVCMEIKIKSLERWIKKLRKVAAKDSSAASKQVPEQTLFKVQSNKNGNQQKNKPESSQNAQTNYTQLSLKINQAVQFMSKLEEMELGKQEEFKPEDIASVENYLDDIIAQNQKDLKQCEALEKMLGRIEQQLYSSTSTS